MTKHDVFISYATPDYTLAKLLQVILNAVEISSYFAPVELPKTPHDFEKGIKNGLRDSSFFVPIFSRHSIRRTWVIFEAGMATALGKAIFPARVEGVTIAEIGQFSWASRMQQLSLYTKLGIKTLVESIGRAKFDKNPIKYQDFLGDVDKLFNPSGTDARHKWIEQLICFARRRWVFIAGNVPKPGSSTYAYSENEFKDFVKELAMNLFNAGFHLCACPQVPNVGRVVLDTAEELRAEKTMCDSHGCEVDYEIGGIYPVDEQLRSAPTENKEWVDEWKNHLMRFRKSYLENKDWLVIVGGNAGTMDEFKAVDEINQTQEHRVKVCAVSNFGGTAKSLVNTKSFMKKDHYFDGCDGWSHVDGLKMLAKNVSKMIAEK